MAYVPQVNAASLELYIGSCATGRCVASSTTLDTVVFAQLSGQPSATTFTPDDVGCPIAIVGGGPVDPLTPPIWFVQGALFHTTIAAYVSPSQVTLTAAPTTSIFNTGFYTIIVYRRCPMQLDTFEFNSSIAPGTRDTLNFTALTARNSYISRFSVIVRGQPVYLRSTDGTVGDIFGGFIDTLQSLSYPGVSDIFQWTATCASWAGIAGRRVVEPANPQIFANVAGDTVFKKLVLDYLYNEGVSAVAAGAPNISLSCPVGAYINQLLDQVVSLVSTPTTAWYWYADVWRTFVLAQRTATPAPWDVVDGSELLTGSQPLQQSITTTGNQLANSVFGIGQNTLLNALNATIVGNGVEQTFNLPLVIGTTPIVTLNSVPQAVGVLGVDTSKQWYWSQGSTTLTQDSGGTPLGATDKLIVAYQTATPAVAQAPNGASLVALNAIEGTYANYEYVFTVNQPIQANDLLNLATGYETNYSTPAKTCLLYTLRPGLASGQLQSITLPQAGITGSFLIATVKLTSMNNVLVWQYTAFGGANIGDAITGLVQFINRGGGTLQILTPTKPVQVGLHQITIDHTKVVGTDKTNYIFGFIGTYSWLMGPPSGNVAYANGADIYFSTDAAGSTVMAFDLEFYNPATGQIAAWVLIPNLSHTTDTVLYIQYGNPANNVSQALPHDVWSAVPEVSGVPNANYRGVYHLLETGPTYIDSTKYNNNSVGNTGSGYPSRVAGVFGYAIDCPSSSFEGIAVQCGLLGDGFNNFSGTLECWIKTTTAAPTSAFRNILDAQVDSPTPWGFALLIDDAGHAAAIISNNGTFSRFASTVGVIDGVWHYLVVTMDATNTHLYVDGVLAASAGVGQNEPMTNANPVEINSIRGGLSIDNYIGQIAEPKVSQAAFDANLIATTYANQHAPGTFYSMGNSTAMPPPQTTNVNINPQGTVTHVTGALTANLPVLGNGGGDVKIGVAGQLVPAGGSTGQVLAKLSATNYDAGWVPPDSDILINGATTLNIIQVNAVEGWRGQTEIQLNGTFV